MFTGHAVLLRELILSCNASIKGEMSNHKWDVNPIFLKKKLLMTYEARGAEYPAEHNVGHEYDAKSSLKRFYKELDPNNVFNPGIGGTSKKKYWK